LLPLGADAEVLAAWYVNVLGSCLLRLMLIFSSLLSFGMAMSESALLRELELLRVRVDRIERVLEFIVERLLPEEEMTEDDREALREALEEYRRGETIPLEEVLERLEE